MLAKMSHHLLSATWRTRKACGAIWVQRTQNQRLMESGRFWISKHENREHQYPRQKTDVSAQAGRTNSPFLSLFVLFGPPRNWRMPTHIGEGHLHYSAHQLKCQSLLGTSSWTNAEIMLISYLGSLSQSSWYILTITNMRRRIDKNIYIYVKNETILQEDIKATWLQTCLLAQKITTNIFFSFLNTFGSRSQFQDHEFNFQLSCSKSNF